MKMANNKNNKNNKNQTQQKMKTGKRIDNAWMMAAAAFGFAVMTHSASAATTILISPGTGASDDIKNGGFESGSTGTYPNYTVVTDWFNFSGGTGVIAAGNDRERTGAYGGSVALTQAGASRPAVGTGHTIAAGETFNLTFYYGSAEDWDVGTDTIGVFLYSTAGVIWTTTVTPSQNALTGAFTQFTANNIAAANIGQTLFLRFESNAGLDEYAAVDDVTLTVSPIPEPSAALLGGLGLLALLRRRRS
jgi:MYXO-CTERM domain-containing protein